jgi:hypothetical protein
VTSLLENRRVAAAKLIELTSDLADCIGPSISRLPKTQLRKLDMIHDFASLLSKLLPGIADELGLEQVPIQVCLRQIGTTVDAMSRS